MTTWTEEENTILRRMKRDCRPLDEIMARLGRSRKSVSSHWASLNYTQARREQLAHRRLMNKREKNGETERSEPSVPPEVWAEREARLSAPITITGFVFGDPPRGFSARERRA